ncbi:TetR/AcrR family transcriptional regulator [Streptomyces sp. 8K308]|uniref:TetR/AcrR family transcriptional regulator n=1 Tax=Streptomyces sp. 8K308 TaxID=2530388 RepID=UPI001048928A|nr:helix-turn-helix domain-containing protein [Streptomyces sp. 8K308]TDC12749.1 TetR/AcrR family transcriptional regulator [Streptomyces sp. 8K308]
MATTSSRRQRRDAVRNREQLLEAATRAFAERGLAVDVREIAREAGVGVGTFYRHFPTKDDLLQAVIEPDLAAWSELTERADAAEDAWQGLRTFVESTLALMVERRAILDGLGGAVQDSAAVVACQEHLRGALTGLVDRAHGQGALRSDVSAADVGLQIMALGRIVQMTAEMDPEAWRRHAGFVLDGLRAADGPGGENRSS